MTYTEMINWATEKRREYQRNKVLEIKGSVTVFETQPDAFRELVLEQCHDASLTPLCEMNIINHQDIINEKKKYEVKLSEFNNAKEPLQKAFDETYNFVDKVYDELNQGAKGLRTFDDVIENLEYQAPQTYEFHQCAKILGFELREKRK